MKQVAGSDYYLRHAGLLLGLLLNTKKGGSVFLRNVFDFQRTTRRYIPNFRTLYNHRNENLKYWNFLSVSFFELFNVFCALPQVTKTSGDIAMS
jgi:hypothetical protein